MNDESTPKGAPEAVAAYLDLISFLYAAHHESACRDEWGNAKKCARDAFSAGRAVGYQEAADEARAAAWPLAQYVTGGASKTGLSDKALREMFTGVQR